MVCCANAAAVNNIIANRSVNFRITFLFEDNLKSLTVNAWVGSIVRAAVKSSLRQNKQTILYARTTFL
jgi:hypothetical protein